MKHLTTHFLSVGQNSLTFNVNLLLGTILHLGDL